MAERRREDVALETALEIELRGERAPDVAALLFATEQSPRVAQPASRFERWLVAALLLVAAGVVTLIAVADRSGSEAVPLQQDPERRLRMFHRYLVTPEDLEELIDNFAMVDSLTIVRSSVPRPDGKGEVAIVQHPLEGLADLFGQGLAKPELSIATQDLESWSSRLALVLSDVHDSGPRFVTGSIELVWRVPERGELVCWLQRGGDGVARLGVQGLPRSWRGAAVENLFGRAEELLLEPTRAALQDRGIAIGGDGLETLPDDTTRLRLYGLVPDDVAALRRFRAVRQIDLSGSPRLLDAVALAEFADVVNPRSLILPLDGLHAGHLEALSSLGLDELFLGDPYGFLIGDRAPVQRPGLLGDEAAAVLANFEGLRELSIEQCDFTDDGLAALAELPLESLMLGSSRISGRGFAAFPERRARTLRSIALRGTGALRPESFDVLCRLPNLERLAFVDCVLPTAVPSDVAAARAPELRSLAFDESSFVDGLREGLPAAMQRFRSIRELRLREGPGRPIVEPLAELTFPVPVQRLELVVAQSDGIESARASLAAFRQRHPDLHLSIDSW